MSNRIWVAAAAMAIPFGAARAEAPCAMTYEFFETAVAHIDIEHCPDNLDPDKVFCRISVGGDHAHVFYFSLEGERCLLRVESFDDDEVEFKFKRE